MEPARYDERGDIKEGAWLATRTVMFSCAKSAPRAFSSDVDTSSYQENASKTGIQGFGSDSAKTKAPGRFCVNGWHS
jgi:hypothetical protein